MKVIYLTTAMSAPDFASLNGRLTVKANPSNQNFHQRLLSALSRHHQTTAISYRPLPRYGQPLFLSYESKIDHDIEYRYLPICNLPFLKQRLIIGSGCRSISKLIDEHPEEKPLLFVDAMNATLRRLARKIRRRHGVKTIGIVTDNPYLLSGVSSSWAKACLKGMRKFDAFIVLTTGLKTLVNPDDRPSFILPGVIDADAAKPKTKPRPYFFFAGALHARYGVNLLIEAFDKLTEDVDLLIAGHGPVGEVNEAARKNSHVKYLGQLPASEIREWESGALANVNPRPLDNTLDAYSIPSKFFEYMVSGALTISTRHPCLTRFFENDVIWAGNGSVDEIYNALHSALHMEADLKIKMAVTAKETMFAQFGVDAVAEYLAHFTNSFK
jgi:glycosyltransferase involved in cell wall biosynthesis